MSSTDAKPDEVTANGSAHSPDLDSNKDELEQKNHDMDNARPDDKHESEKQQKDKDDKEDTEKSKGKEEKQPAGGHDSSPIPPASPGYTIKITIHRAENLPIGDINALSSDPYVLSQLYTTLPTRHKEDPPLRNRTCTIRHNVNPEWNADWIVANVPSSGFLLKCRLYDEDPGDHDDRLGNAHIEVPSLNEHWEGFSEKSFRIKKRMGSKRAYLVQALATGVRQRKSMTGHLIVSIKMLGRTKTEHGGRVYTVGPCHWTKHYSPILGRMVGKKTPGKEGEDDEVAPKKKTERYKYAALLPRLYSSNTDIA
jgi:C2 domain